MKGFITIQPCNIIIEGEFLISKHPLNEVLVNINAINTFTFSSLDVISDFSIDFNYQKKTMSELVENVDFCQIALKNGKEYTFECDKKSFIKELKKVYEN